MNIWTYLEWNEISLKKQTPGIAEPKLLVNSLSVSGKKKDILFRNSIVAKEKGFYMK